MKNAVKKILSAACVLAVLMSSAPAAFSYDGTLPQKYSSAEMGYIRPAENQYDSAGCWAFSSLGVLSAYSVKHGLYDYTEADFSEAHLIWFNGKSRSEEPGDPMFGDGMNSAAPYDEGSRLFTAAFNLAKGCGAEWEINYPFNRDNSRMGNYFEEARCNHPAAILTEAKLLKNSKEIKQAVYDYGAAEAGIYYDEAKLYNTARRKYVNGEYVVTGNCCYLNKEKSGDGHNITIIGWDDNYSKSNFSPDNMPKGNGAWLCKNSWGTAWGENGLFWISYENAVLENVMTYACVKGDEYNNIYQYDGYGFNSRLYMANKKTASAANVFTAESPLTVEAIGFYTYQNSSDTKCEVNIDIYTDLPGECDGPVFGESAISFTTEVSNDGYHTAVLPDSIAVDGGEKFSVVVSITASQGNAVMLLEGNPTGSVQYGAGEGQSYISFNGTKTGFYDTAKKHGGNVCIKALTRNYNPGTVSAVYLDEQDKTVSLGYSGSLSARINPLGQSTEISWSSSATDVVAVDSNGNYRAVGTGTAVITASAQGKSDSITITVNPKNYFAGSIKIVNNPGTKTINYGETLCLSASVNGTQPEAYFGWYINGTRQAERSAEFKLENAAADVTVTVRLEDKSGNALVDKSGQNITDSEKVNVNAEFFKKLISFFKNLFKVNRTVYN